MSGTDNNSRGATGIRPAISTTILIVGVSAGLFLCYLIAAPFVPAIVWSLTLALLFSPLQAYLERVMRSPSLAALLSVVIAALAVVVPAVIISGLLLGEAIGGAVRMAEVVDPDTWAKLVAGNDALAPVAAQISSWLDLTGLLDSLAVSLSAWSGDLIQGSIKGLITMLVTFFFLFYFLRDRAKVIAGVEEMLPFTASEFAILAGRVTDTVYASVYGTLVVATVQGALGGQRACGRGG